ncbi:ParB/RepB/Spo0J family partition protein [bacterium]
MNIVDIPIKEIQEDFFFCFTSERDDFNLRRSIEVSGIRTPLHARRVDNVYQLLSGFHRYRQACNLNLDTVPAVLIQDDGNLGELFYEILLEQLNGRSFNLVEKARILSILDGLGFPPAMIHEKFFSLLEIPVQGNVVSEIKTIQNYSQALQMYIEKYDISLKQVMIFSAVDTKTQDLLAHLGFDLAIRSVELTDITQQLMDIARRENSQIQQILEGLNLETLVQSEEMSRNEKLIRLKAILKEKKLPRLISWNNRLSDLYRSMDLPENCRVTWDPTLEGPGVHLIGEIRSLKDVETIIQFLSEDRHKKTIHAMMKIV